MNYCDKKCGCGASCGLAVFVGILFGIAVGVLFAFGLVPNITLAAWAALAIGIVALALLFAAALASGANMCGVLGKCVRQHAVCLLVGIIGTIISAIIIISITIVVASLIVQIFVAILAFFFAFMLTELINLIICLACESRLRE